MHALVYSDGLLSALGHDHVITADDWKGRYDIKRSSDFQATIEIDLVNLSVDRQDDRSLYPHLARKNQPAEEDILATKTNMLGIHVLDVSRYPMMYVQVQGNLKKPLMTANITLRGHDRNATVEYESFCDNNFIKLKGNFRLMHEDFGIKPYTTLFGAIKVAQPIDFYFQVVIPESCSQHLQDST